MRDRAWRRRKDVAKALHKRRIVRDVYRWKDWYDNLHQYSKNKVHCSCSMCGCKTHNQFHTGPATTWPAHDEKHLIDMNQQLNDYDEGEPYEDECDDIQLYTGEV